MFINNNMTVNFTVTASVSFIVAARSFIVNVNVTDDVFSLRKY